MSLALGALALGRSLAAIRFTETVQVVTRTETTNPTTLVVDAVDSNPLYTGVAQISFASGANPNRIDAGARQAIEQSPTLKVPTEAAIFPNRAIVTVQSSSADSSLVGSVFRIVGIPASGQVTSHRYELEAVLS